MKPNERLREAREAAGKTEADMEKIIGSNAPTYYDLEAYDDELYMNMTLGQLRSLCAALGITIRGLFGINGKPAITFTQLAQRLLQHLDKHGLSMSKFEEAVGWGIGPMENPEKLWEGNVDCLRDICRELGLSWEDVLPE